MRAAPIKKNPDMLRPVGELAAVRSDPDMAYLLDANHIHFGAEVAKQP